MFLKIHCILYKKKISGFLVFLPPNTPPTPNSLYTTFYTTALDEVYRISCRNSRNRKKHRTF
uniref:Uncharacterized protein n=1 Tax=Anguilla anguilla TaxID=7936 RepID=A0A0E9QA97_ANGAN